MGPAVPDPRPISKTLVHLTKQVASERPPNPRGGAWRQMSPLTASLGDAAQESLWGATPVSLCALQRPLGDGSCSDGRAPISPSMVGRGRHGCLQARLTDLCTSDSCDSRPVNVTHFKEQQKTQEPRRPGTSLTTSLSAPPARSSPSLTLPLRPPDRGPGRLGSDPSCVSSKLRLPTWGPCVSAATAPALETETS